MTAIWWPDVSLDLYWKTLNSNFYPCLCVFYSKNPIVAACVGKPSPNGGTRAGVPHTRVPVQLPAPIGGRRWRCPIGASKMIKYCTWIKMFWLEMTTSPTSKHDPRYICHKFTFFYPEYHGNYLEHKYFYKYFIRVQYLIIFCFQAYLKLP
jgi:hypothetical protein